MADDDKYCRLSYLDRNGEYIPLAVSGLDDFWQLTTQSSYLHVDAAGTSGSGSARRFEEMLSIEHALRRINEGPQQGTLLPAKLYIVTSRISEAQCITVELPPAAKTKPGRKRGQLLREGCFTHGI